MFKWGLLGLSGTLAGTGLKGFIGAWKKKGCMLISYIIVMILLMILFAALGGAGVYLLQKHADIEADVKTKCDTVDYIQK